MRRLFLLASILLAIPGLIAFSGEVWVTVATEDLPFIQKAFEENEQPIWSETHKTHRKVTMLKVDEEQIPVITLLLHENNHRCGGLVAHPSYEMAIAEVQRDLLRSSPQSMVSKMALSYPLDRSSEVNTVLGDLSEANIVSTITQLSSYTTRYYTSQTAVQASNWMKSEWESMAAGRSDISVELYNHSWAQPSVIMTITGAHQPQDIIIIGGHIDSINQSGSVAPGADDDASGIATFTEAIRAALSNGFTPARTIKFIAYAAEEVGLRGSADIATAAQSAGDNIIGVLQLDMTNYNGSSPDIVLMQDYTNAAQNTFVGNLIDTYTSSSWATDNCGYGCSDHASWHNRGYATSMPFESYMNQYNSNIHTANDTLSVSGNNAIHAMKFAQMTVAYMIELGKGGLNGNSGTDPGPVGGGTTGPTELNNGDQLTGLGASSGSEEHYVIDVPAGATNLQISTSGGTGDVDLYTRFGSQPTSTTYNCRPYASGNNENCNEPSPSAGSWYIMLKAYSTYSNLTLSVSYTAPGNTPPSASFTSSKTDLSVSFTDTSTDAGGSISSWSWNFGDGNSSTQQNPTHTYATAGSYTVTLTVTDNDNNTDSASATVSPTDPVSNVPPTAAFTHSASNLLVNFTDTSSDSDGSIVTWSWNFGDGQTATSQDPNHTYATAGSYSVSLTVTDNDGASDSTSSTVTVTEPTGNVLNNGDTVTNQGASTGGWIYYTINLPTGATNLSVSLSGSNGDADMYLRHNSQPTTSVNDCSSTSSNSNESCTVASPASGTWHIGIYAYATFSGASLTASFTEPGQGCTPGGWTETNQGASTGNWLHFTLDVPACATNLTVSISGGSGDADLYTRFGAQPTTSSYDCRPWKNGNSETCTQSNPSAGTWYISVRAYSTFSGLTINADYN